MKRVLVCGATGFLGRHVCEHLARCGMIVVAPVRRRTRARFIQTLPGLEVREAPLFDASELHRLLHGCDAVVNLIGILHGRLEDFERIHVTWPRQLVQACQAAGVRRVVHVSAIGAESSRAPSIYLRSKGAGEAALRNAHALDVTIFRPSLILADEAPFVRLIRLLAFWLPFLPLAGGRTQFQPVAAADLAEAIALCLPMRQSFGKTFNAVGPRVFSLAELARQIARLYHGHSRIVWSLPDMLARIQARVFELWPGRKLLTRDNLDSLRLDSIDDRASPSLGSLGIEPMGLAAALGLSPLVTRAESAQDASAQRALAAPEWLSVLRQRLSNRLTQI